MTVDWDKIDQESSTNVNQPKYKNHAPVGKYKVKLESVQVIDRPTWKSPALRFAWAEDNDYKYPQSVYHWLSIPNPNYRASHNRNLLMALGVEKVKAQQLIDKAEADQDRIKLTKAYEAMWNSIASRRPEVEIEVQGQWREGTPVVLTTEKGTTYTPTESDFTEFNCRVMDRHEPAEEAQEIDPDESPF